MRLVLSHMNSSSISKNEMSAKTLLRKRRKLGLATVTSEILLQEYIYKNLFFFQQMLVPGKKLF